MRAWAASIILLGLLVSLGGCAKSTPPAQPEARFDVEIVNEPGFEYNVAGRLLVRATLVGASGANPYVRVIVQPNSAWEKKSWTPLVETYNTDWVIQSTDARLNDPSPNRRLPQSTMSGATKPGVYEADLQGCFRHLDEWAQLGFCPFTKITVVVASGTIKGEKTIPCTPASMAQIEAARNKIRQTQPPANLPTKTAIRTSSTATTAKPTTVARASATPAEKQCGAEPSCGSAGGEIAFWRKGTDGWQILLMDPDGHGVCRVFCAKLDHDTPVLRWSPDGSKIAFLWNGLCVLQVSDASIVKPAGSDRGVTAFDWSPDGTRLAFGERLPTGSALSVVVVDAKGAQPEEIARLSETIIDDVSWAPDGSKIALSARPGRYGKLYTVDTRSRKVTLVSGSGVSDSGPRWKPGGSQIVCTTVAMPTSLYAPVPDPAIVLMNPDGTGRIALLSNRTTAGVSWSPDGSRLAVPSDGGPFCVINADRSVMPVQGVVSGLSPTWSPDGAKIAFYDGISECIYTVNSNGTGVTKLGQGYGPAWRPRGGTPGVR